jgi:hypothetical protein
MSKWLKVAGVVAAVAAIAVLAVGAVSAQEGDPPRPFHGGFRGGFRGFSGWGGDWTIFDKAAETLGMTPTELFEALHAGNTLEEVAEAQGMEMEDLEGELEEAQAQRAREAIQAAVGEGTLSQEQADWMLEGIRLGFMRGPGFGRHQCFGGRAPGQ